MPFHLPTCPWGDRWEAVIDTSLRDHKELHAGEEVIVEAYAMMVLRRVD